MAFSQWQIKSCPVFSKIVPLSGNSTSHVILTEREIKIAQIKIEATIISSLNVKSQNKINFFFQ